jgi:hypothetical protein
MRRVLLVLAVALVMAAMMVAMAAPGFAKAIHDSGTGTFNGEPCEGKAVQTPSGNINAQCKIKPEGGNKGGSGGGGATVQSGSGDLGGPPAEAHGVTTPSGNGNLQAHAHPEQN